MHGEMTAEAEAQDAPAQAPQGTAAPAAAPMMDTGLACLALVARFHGLAADPDQIAHEHATPGRPMDAPQMLLAARSLGLHARSVRTTAERLGTTPLPAVAVGRDGRHFIIARTDPTQDRTLIQDPATGRPETVTREALAARWSGELLLFTSRASIAGELAKFDASWFIPAIVRHRRVLLEVLGVSVVLQLFALVTPLFFQVVMDKVLVHRSHTTLDVITVGLVVVVVFEAVLGGLRTWVFAHTSSRIDVELGARLFRHLLALPMAYFQARRTGDSVARMRELETIRSFLTGHAITLVLDLLFSVVFLALMWHYSPGLTAIVLASLPCYGLLSLALTPMLRARLHEKFHRGAENQAFLVETVSGIDTVKSMAVEPQWTRAWDRQLAAYVQAGFRATTLSTLAGSGVQLVGRLVTVATMAAGTRLVIEGELTVGQLIAFNLLAGQVAQPVMRLAQLWTDFQQVGISLQRLADILDTRTEIAGARGALPPVRGQIELADVTFRYRPEMPEVLRGVSLRIAPGEVIGIVGRSGSGKSTLTRLIQRLHVPERGRVLVDGVDLATVDSTSLRRQIGVVLQDNVLFSRSIRDNIALADPGAPLEAVVQAARLAGAHEFITELPEGYDTMVGEHGATLSGGQRQRLAIARALLTQPRILILDEATSALDYESERILQQNMRAICQGRTVIVIAHRLSAVRHATRIVAMDRGRIVESGTHAELLARPQGLYAHLHRMQQA